MNGLDPKQVEDTLRRHFGDLYIYWFGASTRNAKPRFKWKAETDKGRTLYASLVEPCGLLYPEVQGIGDSLPLPSLEEMNDAEHNLDKLLAQGADNPFRFDPDKCGDRASRVMRIGHNVLAAQRELELTIAFVERLQETAIQWSEIAILKVVGLDEAKQWLQRLEKVDSRLRCCASVLEQEERDDFPHRRLQIEKIYQQGRKSGMASAQRKARSKTTL